MKKTLCVYLHGFGDSAAGWAELAPKISAYFSSDAETLILDAPFDTGFGGYKWFDLFDDKGNPKYDDDAGVNFSINYVKEKIAAHCAHRGPQDYDIILIGHSQGAFMSLLLTLTGVVPASRAVSICGFYPDVALAQGLKNKATPILWLAGAKDDVLPSDLSDSYKALQVSGIPITYYNDPDSDHNYWSPAMFAELSKWAKK
ncbi:MAG: alpha/beta fold hydrolase [Rickettsiales bacterium]|jgi:predicted esterase|nr:alpha/beta fold hydrolase [Rickettsiales bacterium]